jgi:hypothetical protein
LSIQTSPYFSTVRLVAPFSLSFWRTFKLLTVWKRGCPLCQKESYYLSVSLSHPPTAQAHTQPSVSSAHSTTQARRIGEIIEAARYKPSPSPCTTRPEAALWQWRCTRRALHQHNPCRPCRRTRKVATRQYATASSPQPIDPHLSMHVDAAHVALDARTRFGRHSCHCVCTVLCFCCRPS